MTIEGSSPLSYVYDIDNSVLLGPSIVLRRYWIVSLDGAASLASHSSHVLSSPARRPSR